MDQGSPKHSCVCSTAGRIPGNHTRRIVCGSILSPENLWDVMRLGCYRTGRPRRTSHPIMCGTPHSRRAVGSDGREIYLPTERQRNRVGHLQLPYAAKKRIECCPRPFTPATNVGPSTNDQCITGTSGSDVQ